MPETARSLSDSMKNLGGFLTVKQIRALPEEAAFAAAAPARLWYLAGSKTSYRPFGPNV
jgi:hypothetical protein